RDDDGAQRLVLMRPAVNALVSFEFKTEGEIARVVERNIPGCRCAEHAASGSAFAETNNLTERIAISQEDSLHARAPRFADKSKLPSTIQRGRLETVCEGPATWRCITNGFNDL